MPLTRTMQNNPPGGIFQPAEMLAFEEAGRLPGPADNCAIAIRRLEPGTLVRIGSRPVLISETILEGHRFAVQEIPRGESLLSWSLPFGRALRDVHAGAYLCNEKILAALRGRNLPFELPPEPNFEDARLQYHLDGKNFTPSAATELYPQRRTFMGYLREHGRGVGTRNYIVLLGTSARSGPFVRELARRFAGQQGDGLDGIVPVEHTEGENQATNHELTLKTLAGFVTNPNAGAVLLVDYGNEAVNNEALLHYCRTNNYPLHLLVHKMFSIGGSFEDSLGEAAALVHEWIPQLHTCRRTEQPLANLRIGLQCGGSDAFSGVTANPLTGILARETIRHGGSANLAETDELIGAEQYVLSKVRNLETAEQFLAKVQRFSKWAALHGHSAEGNPSGGNMFRGLYNISIKSIGAARKKDPAARLDYVIDYADPMREPGFYFMDSPGNDLESIAGQVGCGCNLILFATGNGSITNFPFVPTIKYMTTTARFELVRKEMDFNAGRYLDGENLESLGREAFDQLIRIASGEKSAGEQAGHSQVQLWREWRQGSSTRKGEPSRLLAGTPLIAANARNSPSLHSPRADTALVLPTSLCAGQIATIIALRLQTTGLRATSLPHTEGCGNAAGDAEELFMRTMAGYLAHPRVSKALLLEHGCEKTHNDAFRHALEKLAVDHAAFGFASIQLDGGIDSAIAKCLQYFQNAPAKPVEDKRTFAVGLLVTETPRENLTEALRLLATSLMDAGGTTVLTENLTAPLDGLPGTPQPTLAYGQRFLAPGLQLMETPTLNVVEIITGLCATGIDAIVVYSDTAKTPSNPLVPVVQICSSAAPLNIQADADLVFDKNESASALHPRLESILRGISAGEPSRSQRLGNAAFQITRGYFGISL